MKKQERIKVRDTNILAAFRREINLCTRVVHDKKKFSRKEKHKQKEY